MEQLQELFNELLAQVQPLFSEALGIDPVWGILVLALLIWIRLGAIKRETRRTARLLASSGFLVGGDSD